MFGVRGHIGFAGTWQTSDRGSARDRRGVAAVEFALIVPLLLSCIS